MRSPRPTMKQRRTKSIIERFREYGHDAQWTRLHGVMCADVGFDRVGRARYRALINVEMIAARLDELNAEEAERLRLEALARAENAAS